MILRFIFRVMLRIKALRHYDAFASWKAENDVDPTGIGRVLITSKTANPKSN